MPSFLFCLLILITCSSASAKEHSINEIAKPGEFSDNHYSIFLDNGEIVEIHENNETLVQLAKKAFESNKIVLLTKISSNTDQPDLISHIELTVNITKEAAALKSLGQKRMFSPEARARVKFQTLNPLENANISMLPSYEAAQSVMDDMKGYTDDDSQCYNRAHMWTYEALAQNRVNLGKLWIYFSRKYIKEFKYKWWFHIAPYAHIDDENVQYVLDRGFTMVPYNVENWKNIFMKNNAECRVVDSYSTYEIDNGSRREYCYLIYSSQYYWQPWQLKRLGDSQTPTWGYVPNEMRIAYKDALRRKWDKVIPPMSNKPVPVYSDGRVYPQRAPREVEYYQNFRKKTRVLYNFSYRGKIKELYSNGTARIDLEGADDVFANVEDIGREVGYFQGWREKDEIIDSQGRTGEIEHLFDNGWAIIDVDDHRRDVPMALNTLRRMR